ncbi:MAG: hypothetical protein D6701_05125 [Gemmatimonadetes bacterium]|nr:MAG: hypothetical protein D6701_05125 [Gemmatimonadota bacterium]
MAVRFIDHRGTEVTLPDERAFAFRVQLGEIGPRTLVFDDGVRGWVRAESHPLYQRLAAAGAAGTDSPSTTAPDRAASPSTRRDSGPGHRVERGSAGSEEDLALDPFDTAMARAVRGDVEELRARPDPTSNVAEGPARAPRQSAAAPGPTPVRYSVRVRRLDRGRWTLWTAVAALAVALVVYLITAVGDGRPWPVGRRVAGETASRGGTSSSGGVVPSPAPPADPRVAVEADAMARGALHSLVDALPELRELVGLPPGPPEHWLEGHYLASAASYPGTLDYWDAFRALVRQLRSEEVPRFEAALDAAAAQSPLTPEQTRDARAEAERRLSESAQRRRAVYALMEELANAATDLHAVLLRIGDQIDYQPVQGPRVSVDPVLEAVPRTPAAEAEFAAALDRVLATLEAVNGLAPVTTEGLLDALARRLADTLPTHTALARGATPPA